jgi:hypothetical protein
MSNALFTAFDENWKKLPADKQSLYKESASKYLDSADSAWLHIDMKDLKGFDVISAIGLATTREKPILHEILCCWIANRTEKMPIEEQIEYFKPPPGVRIEDVASVEEVEPVTPQKPAAKKRVPRTAEESDTTASTSSTSAAAAAAVLTETPIKPAAAKKAAAKPVTKSPSKPSSKAAAKSPAKATAAKKTSAAAADLDDE